MEPSERSWKDIQFLGFREESPGFYIGNLTAKRSDRVIIILQIICGINGLTVPNLFKKIESKMISAFTTLETFRTCACKPDAKCEFHMKTAQDIMFRGHIPRLKKEDHE